MRSFGSSLFLNCYEIYTRLSNLYVSNSLITWNMGSPSKGRHNRLLHNKLGVYKTMSYNGWANYETWNVALWLDNDPISYHYAKIAKNYEHYRNLKITRTGDGVSLWDPILDTKQLDDKIKELKPCLTDEVTLNDYLGA